MAPAMLSLTCSATGAACPSAPTAVIERLGHQRAFADKEQVAVLGPPRTRILAASCSHQWLGTLLFRFRIH